LEVEVLEYNQKDRIQAEQREGPWMVADMGRLSKQNAGKSRGMAKQRDHGQ